LNATSANALQSSENPFLAAALAALADLPAPEPVPAVSMLADGHLLIIGELEVALGWAERLAGQREVTVLALGERLLRSTGRTPKISPSNSATRCN
jgi:hypothetical protein